MAIPDISNNNTGATSENWPATVKAGTLVAACKASEGNGFVDYTFGPNWVQMLNAGMQVRIAYHFAHPSQTVASNADLYERAVNGGGPLRMSDRRCLDMEVYESQTPAGVVAWALAWEQQTRSLGGGRPLLYTFLGYLQWLGAAAAPLVNTFDLWIADYAANPPASVAPWGAWSLWQYTETGTTTGINGRCDLSVASSGFLHARPVSPPPSANGLNAPVVAGIVQPSGTGYRLIAADGGVFDFQTDYYGSTGATKLNAAMVAAAVTPSGQGYWEVGADGGIFCFGDAGFYGSLSGIHLNAPICGVLPTASGQGYWLFARDGGTFSYGDATFQGSMGGTRLNAPIVAAAAHPGGGYILAGADGGVFPFSAPFEGSGGSLKLNAPIAGAACTPSGQGYWLCGSDGGIYSFGDAKFFGSLGAVHLNAPVVGMQSTPSGGGYYMFGADGGVFTFGDAAFHGAM